MSINYLLRSVTIGLFFMWLPLGSFATYIKGVSNPSYLHFDQDKKDKKQERGKENKKPEVKEVPQSRRQEKPVEVKPGKKEKTERDNKKGRN